MTLTIEARVANGAAYLDSVLPDWWRQIDLGLLDLSDGCRCVLAQLARPICEHYQPFQVGWTDTFGDAINAIGRHVPDYGGGWTAVNGFIAYGGEAFGGVGSGPLAEYRALDEAWIALIKERYETQ